MKMVDISRWQNRLDGAVLAGRGIRDVMIRAGHGVAGKDGMMDAFAAECKKNGIRTGFYWFSTWAFSRYCHNNEAKARELMESQMGYFLHLIEGQVDGWVAIDQENEPDYGRYVTMDKAMNTRLLNRAAKLIRQAGHRPCLYCSVSWLRERVDLEQLAMPVWVAWYYAKQHPDFDQCAALENMRGPYAELMQELHRKEMLVAWQFASAGFGGSYGVGSPDIDRNILYMKAKGEGEMFEPIENMQLVVTGEPGHKVQAFASADVDWPIYKDLAPGVYPLTAKGGTEEVAGMTCHWYKIEDTECPYVAVLEGREAWGYVQPKPKPEPKPEANPAEPDPEANPEPTGEVSATIHIELQGPGLPDKLRKIADILEGE